MTEAILIKVKPIELFWALDLLEYSRIKKSQDLQYEVLQLKEFLEDHYEDATKDRLTLFQMDLYSWEEEIWYPLTPEILWSIVSEMDTLLAQLARGNNRAVYSLVLSQRNKFFKYTETISQPPY